MSDIDAMIAEAFPQAEAQPQADAPKAEVVTEAAPQEQVESEETDSQKESEIKAREPWPKSAENKISRLERKIGKLQAQLHQASAMQKQAQAQKPEVQTSQTKPTDDGAPKESDYETYADYLEARTEWKLEKKLSDMQQKQSATIKTEQEQVYLQSRIAELDRQTVEFAKEYPEINSMMQEHAETIAELPANIRMALLKADNTNLAFYNLAKSGVLEELGDMSFVDALAEIKLAQRTKPAKPQTKAPKPLPSLRGSAQQVKSLADMSAGEALKQLGIYS